MCIVLFNINVKNKNHIIHNKIFMILFDDVFVDCNIAKKEMNIKT